jgi:hypothetical protein
LQAKIANAVHFVKIKDVLVAKRNQAQWGLADPGPSQGRFTLDRLAARHQLMHDAEYVAPQPHTMIRPSQDQGRGRIRVRARSKTGKGLPGVGCPPGTSRTRQHDVIRQPRSVSNGRQDVLDFKKGIIRQNLLVTRAMTQEIENIRDAHSFATDAGLSAAFAWLNGDSLK